MRIGEHGAIAQQLDAGLRQARFIDAFEPRDLAIAVDLQCGPVQARVAIATDLPAVGRCLVEFLHEARGIDHQLLRHATADHAGAAHAVCFGQRDARAVAGGDARRAHTARAAADDEEIDLTHAADDGMSAARAWSWGIVLQCGRSVQ